MKRIATANRAVDLFAAGKDGFRAAVPGVSDATYLSALLFNHVQEAVVRVIEAAGLPLSDTDFDQFVTALNTLITNAGAGFSTVRPLAVTTVLTAADFGKLIKVTATGATLTFPAIAVSSSGKVLSVIAEFAAGTTTLKGNAAELLASPLGVTANTFTLNAGETIQYVSNGVSWDPIGYEATVGVTPAQFDTSTKLANMAALQRALGNLRGATQLGIGATSNLTTAQAGGYFQCQGGTVNLPATAGVTLGSTFYFSDSSGSGTTINAAATEAIYTGSVSSTSYSLNGTSLALVLLAAGVWEVVGGSAELTKSNLFAASLAAGGYQKLPGGFILQWGGLTTSASADVVCNFPIAFPTACYFTGLQITSNAPYFLNSAAANTTSVTVGGYTPAGARIAVGGTFIAIGK